MHLRTAVILALVVTGCAEVASPSDDGRIDHPTGASDLLLRVDQQGGFVPVDVTFTSIPMFTLEGDGTLIRPGAQIEIYPGPALPPLFRTTLDEDQIQAVLRAALDAGLDHDATYGDLGSMGIADAPTTVFGLHANGMDVRVAAYALGIGGDAKPDGMPQETWSARRNLQRLVEQLGDLGSLVPGSIPDEQPYVAERARILVRPYQGTPDLAQEPVDWPLDSSLASSGDRVDALGGRCSVVAGADWDAVRNVAATANQLTPWVSDGRRWSLTFRPLLADESGC